MTKTNEVYKCMVCGNIVEMVHSGAGELVCCGKLMNIQTENIVEAATEKHIPVIEKTGNKLKITVGEVNHPMEESHFIEWIEVITKEGVFRNNLTPSDEPVAEFEINTDDFVVRAYCNLHGLWSNKK